MRDILRIAAPFTLWIAAFSAVYGLEGMVCSRHGLALAPAQSRRLLVTAWLGVIALQAGLLWTLWSGPYGSPTRFGRLVSRTLGLSVLVATVWTLAPVATLPVCHAGA